VIDDPEIGLGAADAAWCRDPTSRPPASSTARRRSSRPTRDRSRPPVIDPRPHAFRGRRQGRPPGIIVTELPYQVNKARLIERIADLVRDKQIEGIASDGLRDESDKDGMRIVIELRRGENAEVVLNNLYAQTPLETVFGINMVALRRRPAEAAVAEGDARGFVRHRREVVTRRTIFDLRKARDRAHMLEGLAVALANIDEIIALIKASPAPPRRSVALMSRSGSGRPGACRRCWRAPATISTRPEVAAASGFGLAEHGYRLSDVQAQAILDMRLNRLTGLEQDKIIAEYQRLLAQIAI
jgi:DNA gyrase subunit A